MEKIDTLKLILRETDYPFFSDAELNFYLEQNNGDVADTAYQCLIVKAETCKLSMAGLSLEDTSEYWMNMARMYRKSGTKVV